MSNKTYLENVVSCNICDPTCGFRNRLLADRELRVELGRNARAVADTQNVKNTVDAVEEVYRKVLG